MTGEDGYLGQIPEKIWKEYLIALHETDMYEWCLNREIHSKKRIQ